MTNRKSQAISQDDLLMMLVLEMRGKEMLKAVKRRYKNLTHRLRSGAKIEPGKFSARLRRGSAVILRSN